MSIKSLLLLLDSNTLKVQHSLGQNHWMGMSGEIVRPQSDISADHDENSLI